MGLSRTYMMHQGDPGTVHSFLVNNRILSECNYSSENKGNAGATVPFRPLCLGYSALRTFAPQASSLSGLQKKCTKDSDQVIQGSRHVPENAFPCPTFSPPIPLARRRFLPE